jgi:choline dehydrogenase-like flavoprotein
MFQIHVTPTHYLKDSRELTNPALTIAVNATTPRSRGTIRCLRSEQLFAPEINPGYLQASEDLEQLLEGIQWVRELAQQSPLAQHIIGELVPGSHRQTPNELSKAITRYSQTLYHPCGTCALGTTACTVVTEQFAVRGAGRLWIADASILPTITQGNPSAMLLAVGWVAAEEIHLKLEASE